MIKKITIIGIIIVLLFVVASGYLLKENSKLSSQLNNVLSNPEKLIEIDNKNTILKLRSHLGNFGDEEPTIVLITESNLGQYTSYFPSALKGNKIAIFSQKQKSVLYDPVGDKILDMISSGSLPSNQPVVPVVTLPSPTPQIVPMASPTVSPVIINSLKENVVILNGARVAGLTAQYEKTLVSLFPMFTVTERKDAVNLYPKSLIVNLSGIDSNTFEQIASVVDMEVSPLPAAEVKPKTGDILIILGTDKN